MSAKVQDHEYHQPSSEGESGTQPLSEGFLALGVKIELLVDRWYAWPHLLAPVQQGFNLLYRYLPALKSFVAAPAVHAAAARDPEMFGGPFVDLPASDVSAVRQYIATVEAKRADILSLVSNFKRLDASLQGSASGHSLDMLQSHIPVNLRGMIDLVYDLHNHPKIRILEEMFEEDDLGHRDSQEILLHRQRDVDRPFFLSTPRIGLEGGTFAKVTFDDEALQALAGARSAPVDIGEIASAIGIPHWQLAKYFTSEAPTGTAAGYDGEGVRVRYFGHAAILIETRETTILIDPTAAWDKSADGSHLSFEDLPPRIDVLVVSHGHQDHLVPEMLVQLRGRVGTVLIPPANNGDLADPSIKRILKRLGYRSIVTLDPLESFAVADGGVTALPFTGEHCDLDIHSKQCLFIELRGRRICLFVDADAINWEVYKRLAHRFSDADLMLVGMECFGAPLSWLYGPLLSSPLSKRDDDSRRMSGADAERAWRLAEEIRPKQVLVYAMGQEPWMRYLMGLQYQEDSFQLVQVRTFIEKCRAAGFPAELLSLAKEIVL